MGTRTGKLAISLAQGGCGYRANPVFPSRAFRHSAVHVRTDRGIARPQDLRGKVIGVPEYQLTANPWGRGILEDEHGVRPNEISWRRGGMEEPGRREKIVVTPPGIEQGPTARPLSIEELFVPSMLETSKI